MQRIHYISTARAILSPTELDILLARARARNAAVGVTGLLVVGGRRFLQVLEGPEDAVSSIYNRIVEDRRHFAVVTLSAKTVDTRAFEQWSMGFERGGRTGDDRSLEDQVADIIAPIEDANLKAYFAGFAKTHSAAPVTRAA